MTQTTTSGPAPQTTTSGRASGTTLLLGTTLGVVMALAAGLVVFLLGDRGAPVRVITGWEPDGADLLYVDVALTAVSLIVLGTVVLWVLERLRSDGFRIWVGLAVAFTLLTIPAVLRLDLDAGSKLTLSVLHLVVGAAAIGGQVLVRRRR